MRAAVPRFERPANLRSLNEDEENRRIELDEKEFKSRTKKLALSVIAFVEQLPHSRTCDVLGRQLLRSGTSVGANYRAACRGRSAADVIAKLGIVEEEADETGYWLELLLEAKLVAQSPTKDLLNETNEIVAIPSLPSKHYGRGINADLLL